jgi:hypothetical protein
VGCGAIRRILLACAASWALALALSGCGDTLQVKPIPHDILESIITAPYPVYWAGAAHDKLQITEASHDPSGGFSIQYGNCLQGGQGTCTPPLRIVTSPDNSFLPGSDGSPARGRIRGVAALLAEAGRTIVIPTGKVVVAVYASKPAQARSAAEALVPINAPGSPGEPLPAALPDSGYGSTPLPSQLPATVRPLG